MNQTRKILIIDDDIDICNLLRRFFRFKGFVTSEFTNEREALRSLTEEEFDLALCDYRLRELDGQQMIDRIQEIQKIPVIIITAHSDVKTAVATIKKGAYDYIQKPIDPEELLRIVELAISSHQKEDSSDANNHQAEQKIPSIDNLRSSSIHFEYELILKTLDETNNNKTKAAKILKIDRKTLYNKIAQYEQEKNRRMDTSNS
jgi:DNA-binding NtrC family response regulator